MGRPAKPISMVKGHRTKAEKEFRAKTSAKIKGAGDKLVAPEGLTDEQREYFEFFVNELAQAEILGNMDIPLLTNAARCFARLDMIEKKLDVNPDLIFDRETSMAQDRLFKQTARYMNELGLSPASREKLAIKKMENEKQTISDLLSDDE